MNKIMILLVLLVTSVGLFAQSMPIQFDTTAFVSFGVYNNDESDNLDDFDLLLKSTRLGFTGIVRYEFLPTISAGLESGLGIMTYDGGSSFYLDVPINVVARIGFDFVFFEGHVGYYISSEDSLSGTSTGLKIGLGDWFLDASTILADDIYMRYTFGFQSSNLL